MREEVWEYAEGTNLANIAKDTHRHKKVKGKNFREADIRAKLL